MEKTMQTINKPARKSHSFCDAKTRLVDKFNAMVCYKAPHSEFCTIIPKLKEQFTLPQYSWEYLRGYLDCSIQSLYHAKLVFGFMWNGQAVKQEWNNLTEEQKEYCRNSNTLTSTQHHYWMDEKGNITNKQF